ncbi:MAG: tetratricopeptide repeat protein [Planctomycetes bacterium]|nr:tetratricopeptide repeat protein [Planctomycetota bacterium]
MHEVPPSSSPPPREPGAGDEPADTWLAPGGAGGPSADTRFDALWDEVERALREGRPLGASELAARHGVPVAEAEDCLLAARSLQEACAPVVTPTPRALGAYQITGELARGGMGIVYRAWREDLRADFALKVLAAGGSASPEQLQRLHIEARAAARVRHPNVVTVHDVGVDQGLAFLVMDLVPGETLHALLRREGPLAPRRAAALAHALAQGLAAVHALGVLHRDLKPQNVIVATDGRPLLTDFGLAKDTLVPEPGLTESGQFMGTVGYVAPEQARGQLGRVDGRADVYGMGATLYHMLAGAPPFAGLSTVDALAAAAQGEVPPISSARPGAVGPELEAICLKCLEAAPEDRYASAQELADDLARFLEGLPVLARPPSLLRRARGWAWRHRTATSVLVAGAMTLLAATLAAAGGAALSRRRAEGLRIEAARTTYERHRTGFDQSRAAPLPAVGPPVSDAELGLGLQALEAAEEWHRLAPADARARLAFVETAFALGERASAAGQWSLAAYAHRRVAPRAPARAREAASRLEEARTAEARRRREEVQRWLARARTGELAARPEGLQEALIAIARHPEPQTVELLADALEEVAADLLQAEATWVRARLPGVPGVEEALAARLATPPGHDLPRSARDTLLRARQRPPPDPSASGPLVNDADLALAQRDAVTQRSLDMARLACDALGHIGLPGRAVPALGRYLHAEADPLRAVPAGLALARLPGAEARALLWWSARFHGFNGPYRVVGLAAAGPAGAEAFAGPEPDAADDWFRRGLARWAFGDPHGGGEDMTRGLDLEPGRADAWADRAVMRSAAGDVEGALADLERALALDPGLVGAWINRGNLHEASGDLEGAIADFTRAIELAPERPYAWEGRAFARARRGDLAGALADHAAAIDRDPRRAASWSGRGLTRAASGDLLGGIEDQTRALALEPRLVEAWARRGLAREQVGEHEAAHADYTRAIELAPHLAEAWSTRARARLARGDRAGAVSDLTRALELDPAFAEAWLERGRARLALGERAGARADLERFVELAPDHRAAPQARALLAGDGD